MTAGWMRKTSFHFQAPGIFLVLLVLCTGGIAGAQATPADSSATAAADTAMAAAVSDSVTPPLSGLAAAGQAALTIAEAEIGPFLKSTSNKPKAGVKANVRQYSYYGENVLTLGFREGSFSNTTKWSWEDFRKQEKTVEKRSDNFSYNAGKLLPFVFSMTGSWDWTNDLTANTLGFENLFKRETKNGTLSASRTKLRTGFLINTLKADFRVDEQQGINQNQINDFSEKSLSGGYQGGVEIAEGVSIAGRVYGKTTSGTRSLGNSSSPSSASADSAGFGVYFQRRLATGQLAVTRSNFDRQYLDFKKNSNGLIDTVGLNDEDKVVSELETKDAVSIEFENTIQLRRMKFNVKLGQDTDQQDYRVSKIGLKKREQDKMTLTWSFGIGRDSLSIAYKYLWKWDDQRIKEATLFRGRQINKRRDVDIAWLRPLIGSTQMIFKYHEGLSQDIAENVYNQNDKDRLQTDISVRLDRVWPEIFKTTMILSYKQAQDISIRESRSSNNNIKDSYEISPGYVWYVSRWLTWAQSYQIFIQYTDYTYSDLESVNRDDNYNKRGNLTTKVTIKPTQRLDVTVQHDYNKRFNATRVTTDATGNSFYNKDQNQIISKIDLSLKFRVASGVTIEGATYQTEDTKNIFGTRERTTITRGGEVWVGTKVSQKWGRSNPLELSAMVKKYNAYGPGVNETSADYWEADVWLKWSF